MTIKYILISIIVLAALHLISELMHFFMSKKWKATPGNEPDYWIWGMIYFNPDDPRIFVPKRVEWLGWTLNFGQPMAIVFTIITIAVIVIGMLLKYLK